MNTARPKLPYAAIPYLCFFLLISAWAVVQPQYTWDLVGYIGASVDSTNAQTIHDVAFAAIKPIASDKEIQPDNPYRADVTANPYHFAEQLPFSPIAHSTVYQPMSKKVTDMRIESLGYLRFDGVGMQ